MNHVEIRDYMIAISFAAGVAGALFYLYKEYQNSQIRMKDHQWFMDKAKAADMESRFHD